MMLLIPSLPWRLLCAKSEASNVSHASNFELGFTARLLISSNTHIVIVGYRYTSTQ